MGHIIPDIGLEVRAWEETSGSLSSWRLKWRLLHLNMCVCECVCVCVWTFTLVSVCLRPCACVRLHCTPIRFVLVHRFLCLHSSWCVRRPLSVCVHGCGRSPMAAPDNTISVEPEPCGSIQQRWMRGWDCPARGPAQRRRNKLGCHCGLTGLIMLYNLLPGAPSGRLCISLCVSSWGRLHTGGQRQQQGREEGVFCLLLPSWHPLDCFWLEPGTDRVSQLC